MSVMTCTGQSSGALSPTGRVPSFNPSLAVVSFEEFSRSLGVCGFSLGSLHSSHSPETCRLGSTGIGSCSPHDPQSINSIGWMNGWMSESDSLNLE